MARKKYGPITKVVKELCIQLCLVNGSEAAFKDGLRKLIDTDASFHAISLSLFLEKVEASKAGSMIFRSRNHLNSRSY